MVTADTLLAALKVASLRKVTVCGHEVYVRGLTGEERKLLRDRARDGSPVEAHELVALAVCDADSRPIFSAEQAAALAQVDGAEIEAVAAEILKASKLVPESAETAAKN